MLRSLRQSLLATFGLVVMATTVGVGPDAAQAAPPPPGWTITELGTLGGSTSSVAAMNSVGQITGRSSNARGFEHAFRWSASTGMVDLGTLGGLTSSGTAINAAGQVTGSSERPDGSTHAFIWSTGTGMVDLGTLGGPSSYGEVINGAGQVAGTSSTASGRLDAFVWSASQGMVDLGNLGGDRIEVLAINASGHVTGASGIAVGGLIQHAFVAAPDVAIQDLGTLGGAESTARAINDAGQIIGASHVALGGYHAFVWSAVGGMVDLGSLDYNSDATAINDLGQIAGSSGPNSGLSHAFMWSAENGMVDLGGRGGSFTRVNAINHAGQLAGMSFTPNERAHAFLWSESGGIVDLGDLGSPASFALAMNDAGQIAGGSTLVTGETRAVLWSPPGMGTLPAAPTNVTAAQSGTRVTVSWTDGSANESGFELQRARWNGTEWTEWASFAAPLDATSYIDASVPDGRYAYLVRAWNAVGNSDWATGTILHSTATALPAAPTNLTASSEGANVYLDWTDNATNEIGYDIMRTRWVAGVWSEWTSWPADANTTAFIDADAPDGFYAYLVRAQNPLGPSAWAIVTIERSTASAPPAAPTDLTATSAGRDVELAWTDNSTTELLFDVERARYIASTGTWEEWTSWPVDHDVTTSIDYEAPDAQYAYLVRARNPLGASAWAITTIGHTNATAPPTAPTDLSITGGGRNVDLSWVDNATDEFGFDIQRARWNGTEWTEWTSWAADVDTTSFGDVVDQPGLFAYLVRAFNPNGTSAWTIGEFEVAW